MPAPLAPPNSISSSNNTKSKPRLGGNDTAADLELLLPQGKRPDESESGNESPTAATPTDDTRLGTMGLDEQFGMKPEGRSGDMLARNIVWTGAAALVIPTWLIVLFNKPTQVGVFAFHPLLQTLALACFTYGILTLQPTAQPKTKAAGLIRHQTAIFLVGFPSIILGTLSVSYNKWLRSADHLTTWHGTLGAVCMLWLLVQIFLGAGSVMDGGALFGGGMKAKAVWKYHRMSGYVLFPLMLFTAHLGGGWSHWGEKNSPNFVRFVTFAVAPALILMGIYMRVRLSKMKFW